MELRFAAEIEARSQEVQPIMETPSVSEGHSRWTASSSLAYASGYNQGQTATSKGASEGNLLLRFVFHRANFVDERPAADAEFLGGLGPVASGFGQRGHDGGSFHLREPALFAW